MRKDFAIRNNIIESAIVNIGHITICIHAGGVYLSSNKTAATVTAVPVINIEKKAGPSPASCSFKANPQDSHLSFTDNIPL